MTEVQEELADAAQIDIHSIEGRQPENGGGNANLLQVLSRGESVVQARIQA